MPNVQTRGYRLYRYAHEWAQGPFGFMFWDRISCDSFCGPCDCLGRVFVGYILPLGAFLGASLSVIFFFLSSGNDNVDRTTSILALVSLWITFGCLLIPLCLMTYVVCYLKSFFSLVSRNFTRVSRNRVLSNMVYVHHLHSSNEHLEISGHIAAALKRGQLTYD